MTNVLFRYIMAVPAIFGVVFYATVPLLAFWSALIVCAHIGLPKWTAFMLAIMYGVLVWVVVCISLLHTKLF